VTETDELFARVREGDREAFASWMGRVELPLRRGLGPFARAVDVEGVVQETFLRMWLFARDEGRELEGENASLRYAVGMARNIARGEARRARREVHLPPEHLPEAVVQPEPASDPALDRAIRYCFDRVARRPFEALRARLDLGHLLPDAEVAESVGMSRNTFFKNIERARAQMARCLEERGLPLQELLP
jgi:DNA-directed RNA polymerase specialized sigma24 family protein